jgi:hypothetical protein
LTNGFSELPVEAKAFQGQAPSLPAISDVSDMRQRRKEDFTT